METRVKVTKNRSISQAIEEALQVLHLHKCLNVSQLKRKACLGNKHIKALLDRKDVQVVEKRNSKYLEVTY